VSSGPNWTQPPHYTIVSFLELFYQRKELPRILLMINFDTLFELRLVFSECLGNYLTQFDYSYPVLDT
jgi:hypothetical protein